MSVPIWKDYAVTLGSGDAYNYEIRLDDSSGAVIYTGRAYKRPGATDAIIKVNDICADYLAGVLPTLNVPAGFTGFAIQQTFCVLAYVGGAWTTMDTIDFYNDWSYDARFDPSTDPLSDPVTGELNPNQFLVFSTLPATSLTATLTFEDGTTMSVVIPIAYSADFNDDFNDDFSDQDVAAHGGAAVLDLSPFTGLVSVSIGGRTYKVRNNDCTRYALYYVNAYGGWDSLLMDGPERRTDALTRHTALTDYDNTDTTNRGWRDYAVEVTPAMELTTGWLTDAQAGRMHHVIESPNVFLADLQTGDVWAVVLTDSDCVYKTYKNSGKTLLNYTLTAKLAQERIRR